MATLYLIEDLRPFCGELSPPPSRSTSLVVVRVLTERDAVHGVALSQNESTTVVVEVGVQLQLSHVGLAAAAHRAATGCPGNGTTLIVHVDRVRMLVTCVHVTHTHRYMYT